jgi:hypothetical protein
MFIFDEDKVIETFCIIDDLLKEFKEFERQNYLFGTVSTPTRIPKLCDSEIITILTLYHQSGYKSFKDFYTRFVKKALIKYFPGIVTYDRFLTLMRRVFMPLMGIIQILCLSAGRNGIYYVDASKLPVCHNLRAKRNKVFEGIARSGKTSMGWFFGLKLHLVCNEVGEIVAFKITSGNIADNNHETLKFLFKSIKGKVFGDKGYLTKLKEYFLDRGLNVIAKYKDKMYKKVKNQVIDATDFLISNKRGMIETIFDILKNNCDIWHTRHRSPVNSIIHLVSGLIAYQFRDAKPRIIS